MKESIGCIWRLEKKTNEYYLQLRNMKEQEKLIQKLLKENWSIVISPVSKAETRIVLHNMNLSASDAVKFSKKNSVTFIK